MICAQIDSNANSGCSHIYWPRGGTLDHSSCVIDALTCPVPITMYSSNVKVHWETSHMSTLIGTTRQRPFVQNIEKMENDILGVC